MLDTKLATDILAAVDDRFGSQVAFTQDFVRFASLRGQERTCQDFVFRALKERGLSMDRWAIDVSEIERHPGFSPVTVDYDNAINVVGTLQPREQKGRSFILNGHIDVVPPGPHAMWAHPPFEPWVEVGWL